MNLSSIQRVSKFLIYVKLLHKILQSIYEQNGALQCYSLKLPSEKCTDQRVERVVGLIISPLRSVSHSLCAT